LEGRTVPDAQLAAALKQAQARTMYFAFIPGGADGRLIVSPSRVPPKQIAEAKRWVGGGAPLTGKCSGPAANMVFRVAKAAPAALGAALRRVVKRDAGLDIVAHVQLAADADL
jgi:hypothetical protein